MDTHRKATWSRPSTTSFVREHVNRKPVGSVHSPNASGDLDVALGPAPTLRSPYVNSHGASGSTLTTIDTSVLDPLTTDPVDLTLLNVSVCPSQTWNSKEDYAGESFHRNPFEFAMPMPSVGTPITDYDPFSAADTDQQFDQAQLLQGVNPFRQSCRHLDMKPRVVSTSTTFSEDSHDSEPYSPHIGAAYAVTTKSCRRSAARTSVDTSHSTTRSSVDAVSRPSSEGVRPIKDQNRPTAMRPSPDSPIPTSNNFWPTADARRASKVSRAAVSNHLTMPTVPVEGTSEISEQTLPPPIPTAQPVKTSPEAMGIGTGSAYVRFLRLSARESWLPTRIQRLPVGMRPQDGMRKPPVSQALLRKAMDIRYAHLQPRMLASEVNDDDEPDASTSSPDGQNRLSGCSSRSEDSVHEDVGKIKLFVANPDN